MAPDMMDFSTIGQAGISILPMMDVESDNTDMPEDMSKAEQTAIFQQRLLARITELGSSPRKISLKMGANPGYVRDLLDPRKTSVPSAERARNLAIALETTTDWLFGFTSNSAQPVSEVDFEAVQPKNDRSAANMIPVYGTGYCDDLEVTVNGAIEHVEQTLFEPSNVIHLISRPSALSGAKNVYAIYFQGSSMEPRFFQREIGVASPTPPPGPGDFVVLQLNDGNGDDVVHVLVKQLVRVTSAFVELRQLNPDMTFTIDRRRVTRMHRIVMSGDPASFR